MTRHERLQEQYEDALFALAMDELATAEGEKLLEENERLKNDPEAAVPEEISRKCLQTIRKSFTKQKAHTAGRFTVKVFGKIAMAAGIAAMLFTVAFATSDTVRVKTLNLVVEVFGDSTDFYFGENQSTDAVPEVTAGWLPDGYTLQDQGQSEMSRWYLYQGPGNKYIRVGCALGDGAVLGVDTENAETENIQIIGAPALFVKKGDEQQVVWGAANNTVFLSLISTGVEKTDLIHVANAIGF